MILAGSHLYVCIYVCDPPKSFLGTLVLNLPFQTLAVDFSSNLLTKFSSTTARFRNVFFIE